MLDSSRKLLRKVPEVTALFWITKILTTAMGESTSDWLVARFDPPVAVGIGFIAFVAALILQFKVRRYLPWVYWLAVAMVAIFGTMAADVLHVGFGIPYIVSTSFYAIVLVIIFVVWQRTEGTLSIHSITTRRREVFYWLAVLATFALGTAAGDMTATTLGWGYLTSGLIFAVLIAVPAIAYWKRGLNEIAAFWIAYVLTRPLGASFADWFGKSAGKGGIGFGDGPTALVLALMIILCVTSMVTSRHEKRLEEGKA